MHTIDQQIAERKAWAAKTFPLPLCARAKGIRAGHFIVIGFRQVGEVDYYLLRERHPGTGELATESILLPKDVVVAD